jgi:hypothetical protein
MLERAFFIDNFLEQSDWDSALEILHSPGWYYGSWTNESTGQWIRYLDNDEFFSGRFSEVLNNKLKPYGLEANAGYPKNIRANSTGYAIGGEEHADWLGEGKEDWYTLLWYANKEYHPSYGGQFYFYHDTNVHHVMPVPNRLMVFHGHVRHSWLPYQKLDGQRINVTMSLRPIK